MPEITIDPLPSIKAKVDKLSKDQIDDFFVSSSEIVPLEKTKSKKKAAQTKVRYCFGVYAIKKKIAKRSKDVKKYYMQVYINKNVLGHCQYILREYGILYDRGYYLIAEWPEFGTLFEFLRDERNDHIVNWNWKLTQAYNLAQALAFCHAKSILHQDIRSLNVIVNQFEEAKLTNFHYQSELMDNSCVFGEGNETVRWQSPEKMLNKTLAFSRATDVYSFGMLLWEISAHRIPYEGIDAATVKRRVVSGLRPEINEQTPPGYAKIMKSCWDQNPIRRPQMSNVWGELQQLWDSGSV
ncbi:10128_t:CDS:2 [Paraglomus brasilianum]|uniref:10128_t:CDS:1 n=1 Tax=Paraglomus brasilianum TaxID=144538 RepID=A0A9N9DDS2_9GLOM|nr:10128_t:CDS:2 [Paraglomus brasilianum]